MKIYEMPYSIRGGLIALNIYIGKEEKSQIGDLSFYFKLPKDEIKPEEREC